MRTKSLVAGLPCLLFLGPCVSQGQAPPKLEFEVASVRSSGPRPANSGPASIGGEVSGGPGTSDPGQIAYLHVPMGRLLTSAFGIPQDRISAPDWVIVDGNAATVLRFDVVAKVPPGATKDQTNEMLKNLLVERFHMAFHTEQKDSEVYTLVVAKGGPKLKAAAPPDGPEPERPAPGSAMRQPTLDKDGFPVLPAGYRNISGSGADGSMRWTARMTTTSDLLKMLQGPTGIRNVVDQTGLTGKYDFRLEYSNVRRAGAGIDDVSDPAPDVFTALEKQLGLKLEKTKAPLDVVVIDHIEKIPTDN